MTQYKHNQLQNTCDLSQSSSLDSSNLATLKLLRLPVSVAAITSDIKKPMKYTSPRDTVTLDVSNAYLEESIKLATGWIPDTLPSGRPSLLTPINIDAITLPTLRHIGNICDAKNTLTIDGKTYFKKCKIVDETPSYSHFQPNEKTIPLPLHIRSFDVYCKSDYLLPERRKQVTQFNRLTGRVKKSLQRTDKFFDKQKKYIPSPSPSHSSVREREVDLKKSNSQSQANTLTNDAYLTANNTNPVLDAKTKKTYQDKINLLEGLFKKKDPVLKDRKLFQHGHSPNSLKQTLILYPAYVEMKISDLSYQQSQRYNLTGQDNPSLAKDNSLMKRGCIKDFSRESLRRLQLETANYEALGYKAEFMLTLTVGNDFKNINGKKFKKLLDNFGKALARYMKKVGTPDYKVLWFLEFQKRGAPHYHLIFWDMGEMTPGQRRLFRKWASVTWARLVNHPDPKDYAKHLKRGAKFEEMRSKDYRYARAYASKKYQKIVPESYGNVGRFWGRLNHKKIQPIVITQEVSDQMVAAIKEMVLLAYRDISHKVARRVHRGLTGRFEDTSHIKHFAHRLYRSDVVQWFLEVSEILGFCAGEKIPDDALARADEVTKKYFWEGDWGDWLQVHRGILINRLYN